MSGSPASNDPFYFAQGYSTQKEPRGSDVDWALVTAPPLGRATIPEHLKEMVQLIGNGVGIPEAPVDGQLYVRSYATWTVLPDPTNASNLVSGTLDYHRLPNSGVVPGTYSSVALTINQWGIVTGVTPVAGPVPEAPMDGGLYERYMGTWVLGPTASTLPPLMDGFANAGVSLAYARADHIHPVDLSRASQFNANLQGLPLAPTPAPGTNNQQIATTAFIYNLLNGLDIIGSAGITEAPTDNFVYGRYNATWTRVLPTSGGFMTGPLLLAGDPTAPLQAATKEYVDAATLSPNIYIADSPPGTAVNGELWFDSQNQQLYIYYDDPNSDQWVMTNSLMGGPYATVAMLTGSFLPIAGGTLTGPGNLTVAGQLVAQQNITTGSAVAGTSASPGTIFQPTATGLSSSGPAATTPIAANAFNTSAGWVYASNGAAAVSQPSATGSFGWFTAPAGTAGGAITWFQNMGLATTASTLSLTLTTQGSNGANVKYVNASRSWSTGVVVGSGTFGVRDETAGANRYMVDTSGNHLFQGGSIYPCYDTTGGTWALSRTSGYRFNSWRNDGWTDYWNESNGNRTWQSPSAVLMTLDGSGNLTALGTITGANLTTAGSVTGGYVHSTGGVQADVSVTANQVVQSGNGRILSKGTSSPSVMVFNTAAGFASAMWTDGSGNLLWGDSDGAGNPTTTRLYLDRSSELHLSGPETVSGNGTRWASFGGANHLALGWNSSTTDVYVDGSHVGNIPFSPSDGTLKDLKGEYKRGLKEVLGIKPVKFSFNAKAGPLWNHRRVHVGVVAQELEKLIPEAVETREGMKYLSDRDSVVWALVNAVKELSSRLSKLEAVHGV